MNQKHSQTIFPLIVNKNLIAQNVIQNKMEKKEKVNASVNIIVSAKKIIVGILGFPFAKIVVI